MSFTLGYNTNGFAHHRLEDAIDILADIGYRAVGLTLDHHRLNPFDKDLLPQLGAVRKQLERHDMQCVIETGARFLLDPRRKHHPTLISRDDKDRLRRLGFLTSAIDIAAVLKATAVSFWSGAADRNASEIESWHWIVAGCRALAGHAKERGIQLAFEPEPGMLVSTMDDYVRMRDEVNHPRFGLTLDLGHVHCLDDGMPADRIREFAADLRNIHIEDMRRGVHDHLPFGEGEMDFAAIFAAIGEIDYKGPLIVELSRHSHDAVRAARDAFDFITNAAR